MSAGIHSAKLSIPAPVRTNTLLLAASQAVSMCVLQATFITAALVVLQSTGSATLTAAYLVLTAIWLAYYRNQITIFGQFKKTVVEHVLPSKIRQ